MSGPVLKILSPLLVNALNAVVNYYPDQSLDGTVTLKPPFKMLVHYRKELEEHKSQQPSCHPPEDVEERNKHIDSALRFINTKMGTALEAEEARHAQDTPVATFELYWMLLRPGDNVYAVHDGILSPYIVKSVTGGTWGVGRPSAYVVNVWNLNFNGRSLGRCSESFLIKPFDGERAITSISVYPERFHVDKPGQETMRQRMVKRGKRFVQLTKQTYCDYKGQTLTHPKRTVCMEKKNVGGKEY